MWADMAHFCSIETPAGNAHAHEDVRERALSRRLRHAASHHHQRQQMLLARMRKPCVRPAFPVRKRVQALFRIRPFQHRGQPAVEGLHRLSRIEEQIRKRGYSSELAQQWSAANEEYHDALVSACGNSWLMKIRKILHNQSYRYIRFSLVNAGASRDVHEEHRAIFHAAMARDAERACDLIRQHIDNTVNVIVKLLDGQLDEHHPDGRAAR